MEDIILNILEHNCGMTYKKKLKNMNFKINLKIFCKSNIVIPEK
jgi:hypothetical protein